MVGLFCSKRVEGAPLDDWVAVFDFPESKKITRLVPVEVPDPDGRQPIWLHGVSYNEDTGNLACVAFRGYPSHNYAHDVWLYNLRTEERKWIGRKRWGGVSRLAWSQDGQKLAFLATEIPPGTTQPRQADVLIFDLRSEVLRNSPPGV